MSFEHPVHGGAQPEKPQEKTLELPTAIPATGPVPGYPELGATPTITPELGAPTLATPEPAASTILPKAVFDRISEDEMQRYDTMPPIFSRRTKIFAGTMAAGMLLVGIGIAVGANLGDKKETSNATAPVPPGADVVPSPSNTPSPSALSASPSPTPSKSASPSASKTASHSPSASPSKTQTIVVVPSTRPTTAAPAPTTASPTPHNNECSWPMSAQGDSEVRNTCANGAAMEAYVEPSPNSGESFAIYPGLYVHDEAQSGAYTKVSIGGGANKTYGYVLSNLIGNPYN